MGKKRNNTQRRRTSPVSKRVEVKEKQRLSNPSIEEITLPSVHTPAKSDNPRRSRSDELISAETNLNDKPKGIKGIKGIKTFFLAHWKGLTAAAVAVVAWQLGNCILERRARLREFKQAYISLSTATDKLLEGESAYYKVHKSFIDYLNQENVRHEEILQYQTRMVAIAITRNNNCNSLREALDRYVAAK